MCLSPWDGTNFTFRACRRSMQRMRVSLASPANKEQRPRIYESKNLTERRMTHHDGQAADKTDEI